MPRPTNAGSGGANAAGGSAGRRTSRCCSWRRWWPGSCCPTSRCGAPSRRPRARSTSAAWTPASRSCGTPTACPQVYADSPHDLFLAQGYVQAQDRFYEMDVRRHITAGRLSEMFGAGRPRDRQGRAHPGLATGRRAGGRAPRPARRVAYLQAFSDGVNAYLRGRSPGEISLEYSLLVPGRAGLPRRASGPRPTRWPGSRRWRGTCAATCRTRSTGPRPPPGWTRRRSPSCTRAYPYARHRPIIRGGGVRDGQFAVDVPASGGSARRTAPGGP